MARIILVPEDENLVFVFVFVFVFGSNLLFLAVGDNNDNVDDRFN